MAGSIVPSLGRAGAGGFGPTLLAVALALMIVAAEVPVFEGKGLGGGAGAQLNAALEEERAWLASSLNRSWAQAGAVLHGPLVRARLAADALGALLDGRYPRTEVGVRRLLLNQSVALPDGDSELLPPEIQLALGGVLVVKAGAATASVALDLKAPDSASPRARAFLGRTLEAQASDPRAATAAQLRAALSEASPREPLGSVALDSLVAKALERASRQVALEIGGSAPLPEAGMGGAPDAPPPPTDVETLLALAGATAAETCRFVGAQAGQLPLRPATVSLVVALACNGRAWAEAARAAFASNASRFASLASAVLARFNGSWGDAADAVVVASRAFAWSVANQTARAAVALAAAAPFALRDPAALPRVAVSLSARGTSWRLAPSALQSGGDAPMALARAGVGVLRLTLSGNARVFDAGRWVEASFDGPARFEFPVALFGAFNASAAPPSNDTAAVGPSIAARAEPFALTVGWLESMRREIDRRAYTFGEAVSKRVAGSAASALARVAFRLLEGLADEDEARAARALFELMERYFADDLRTALAVNVTVFGLNLTLRPDPVGQQVALEHTEGPHTFGVRVRRVTAPDNPLRGKFPGDPLSLALEIYWRYEAPPMSALLTLDPFLRTDDGLVRFDLRVREGDGLALSLVAPRIVRRSGELELSISDLVPGGIPLGVTASGGELSLDAGVRVEFARVGATAAVRLLTRAVADALIDAMANQTVQEVVDQLSAEALARAFLERLVSHLADAFAALASRFVLRADFFVKFVWAEALGAAAAEMEFGLAILEPVFVLRAEGSAAAELVRAALEGAPQRRPPALSPVDWLPTAVHERVGFSAIFRLRAGVPFLDRILKELPGAHFEQGLFVSLGAGASAAGRRSLHWVSQFTVGFEGTVSQSAAARLVGAYRGDGIEAVHLRVESLSGPRILISEVCPAPQGLDEDLEFVELYNPAFVEEDLTGWTLTDDGGHRFQLPDGTRIAGGGTLVLARSALPFFLRFGVASAVPTLTLALNDEGDRLRLANPRGWVSDEVDWGDGSLRLAAVPEDASLGRQQAVRPPVDLPGSALRFTGTWTDFAVTTASPGRA